MVIRKQPVLQWLHSHRKNYTRKAPRYAKTIIEHTLHPHSIFGCTRVNLATSEASLESQLKFLCVLTVPMPLQTGSFTTSPSTSLEGSCGGKHHGVAGLIFCTLLKKSSLGERSNCRTSAPRVKKASAHPFFHHKRKQTLRSIPLPQHRPTADFR